MVVGTRRLTAKGNEEEEEEEEKDYNTSKRYNSFDSAINM
jgi:hypothetical protein